MASDFSRLNRQATHASTHDQRRARETYGLQTVRLLYPTEPSIDVLRSRGKFRPRLKQLISSNSSDEVQRTTTEAFSKPLTNVEHILAAVKQLSVLKGVGPATATMILQTYSDDIPFMSDEAMLQVFNGDKTKLKYDLKTCGIFIEKIQGILKMVGGIILLIEWC